MRSVSSSLLVAFVLAFPLTACGSSTETPPARNGVDSGVSGDDASSADVDQPDVDYGANTGEQALPCSKPGSTLTKATFHANDGASGPYSVPISTDNPYTCWVFDSGDTDLHVTDWAPLIDNKTVLHHIVLFGGAVNPSAGPPFGGATGPVDCKAHMPLNLFEFGWAPGGSNYTFPSDVEQIIPAHTKMIMQLHYNTGAALGKPQNDTSGIALCTTTENRPKHAGVLLVGSMGVDIPPHSTGTEIVGQCPAPGWPVSTIPTTFDVLGVFPHMHTHGTKIWTEIIRGGAAVDRLGDIQEWSFNRQGFHEMTPAKTVQVGDLLKTHCVYDNPTSNAITWGEDTESEMCFNFMYTVPDVKEAWGDSRANLCFNFH